MNHSFSASVLIISDDPEFGRAIVARWRAERLAPEITLVSSDLWHSANAAAHDALIIGPARLGTARAPLSAAAASASAVLCVAEDERQASEIRAEYPQALVFPRQDGWIGTLILLATEALRRVDSVRRAQRAERIALECQGQATLGRYMLEMRPAVNNALTSVLGNADLLLEPGEAAPRQIEQIETIHAMAIRLNEIMQRFSSLVAEMRAGEKESQDETPRAPQPLAAR